MKNEEKWELQAQLAELVEESSDAAAESTKKEKKKSVTKSSGTPKKKKSRGSHGDNKEKEKKIKALEQELADAEKDGAKMEVIWELKARIAEMVEDE